MALAGENVFLEKALSLREDIVLLRTTAQEAAEIENIDLYVFDGELPETLPQSGEQTKRFCLLQDQKKKSLGKNTLAIWEANTEVDI